MMITAIMVATTVVAGMMTATTTIVVVVVGISRDDMVCRMTIILGRTSDSSSSRSSSRRSGRGRCQGTILPIASSQCEWK